MPHTFKPDVIIGGEDGAPAGICNDGFGCAQLQRAQTFIRAYSACSRLSTQQAQMGWDYFFWRLATSLFMEERLSSSGLQSAHNATRRWKCIVSPRCDALSVPPV